MNAPKFRAQFIAAMVTALWICGTTDLQAAIYYVSKSGSDSNKGNTKGVAYKTINKAAQVAVRGDTVYVGAGTYTETVNIIGKSDGNQRLSFVADVSGTKTGFGGDVVISARVNVVDSNGVELNGFKVTEGPSRLLVWKDSYDGLLKDCDFLNGDEGLLVKHGSLEVHDCEIRDFAHDGIQVDGLAKMFLYKTTIEGCGESAVEVRKVAKIVVDSCSITNNSGDGIEVNITEDTIDDGAPSTPDISKQYLAVGVSKFKMSSGFVKSYNSSVGSSSIGNSGVASSNGEVTLSSATLYGDAYVGPSGKSPDPSRVTGTIYKLDKSMTLPPIDEGDAATNNNNSKIPLSDYGKNPLNSSRDFTLSGGDGIDLVPGTYYFNKLTLSGGSIMRLSGSTIIYVKGADVSGGSIANPSQKPSDLQLYAREDDVSLSGSTSFFGAIYAPNSKVKLSGSTVFYGMLAGTEIDASNSGGIYVDEALLPLAAKIIGGSSSAPQAPPFTDSDISTGIFDVSSSTISGNANGVRFVTEQPFNSRYTDYSNNAGWGLRLFGASRIEYCTINANSVGGMWLKQMNSSDLTVKQNALAGNSQYGLYAETCGLEFNSANIGDWAITGSQYAITGVGTDMSFDNVTISGGSAAGVRCFQGNMKAYQTTFADSGFGLSAEQSNVALYSCTVSGNNVGIYANENPYLLIKDCTITGSTKWGSAVYASGADGTNTRFENCTIHSNEGGLTIVNAGDGEVQLTSGTVIRDNTNSGLHFENCNLTINDQAGGAAWSTLRNKHGISSDASTLTLDGVVVEDSSSYAVHSVNSTLTLSGCTLTGCDGIYAKNNTSTTIGATRIFSTTSGVANWGIYREEGDLVVKNTVINGFQSGVYLEAFGVPTTRIVNTTVAGASKFGIYVADGPAQLINSIVVGSDAKSGVVDVPGDLTHSHNLIYGFGEPFSGTAANGTEVFRTPRFVNADGGDFQLSSGSPAINAGLDVGSDVPVDIDGTTRPMYNAYEIGAYEYASPGGSVRILKWEEEK